MHAGIIDEITNFIFEMGSDTVIPKFSFHKPFKVKLDWDEWRVK